MKENRGITLIALVITIIILFILVGIGIGVMNGTKENIQESKNAISLSDLKKVQQFAIETDIKYKQANNKRLLKGTPISYTEAQNIANEFGVTLRQTSNYNLENETMVDKFYYRLKQNVLKELGMINVKDEAEYIVNYSTGEVFDYANKTTPTGEKLYTYIK